MTYQTIVDRLRAGLKPSGFDLVAPLQVGWYNAGVAAEYRLPDFGRSTSLAVIIANTRELWPRFLAALERAPQRLDVPHPLDDYTREEIERALAGVGVASEVRYAFELPPRRIAIQRVAHAAGLAYLSPTHLCIHPTYGPWIGLRAAVVFDAIGPQEPVELQAPCDCAGGCKGALDQAVLGSDWRAWLRVRDACPVGREHRYSDEQIEYHYVKDPELLTRLLRSRRE